MSLTRLQSDILRCLAENRSETSYLAGGIMLNKDWQRRSDDIDIFHDTDEEVTGAADADIATLEAAGYHAHRDFVVYGAVDATVSDGRSSTIIQWFSETRRRFFPLVRDARRTIDEIRRHALSIPAEEFVAVKGLPAEWTAEFVRDEAVRALELADKYLMAVPPDLVGLLAVNKNG